MTAGKEKLHFHLLTPSGPVIEEEVDQLTITTKAGEITILPRHIPLIASLKVGHAMVKKDGEEHYFAIDGGVLEVRKDGTVIVLSNRSEKASEIDVERAREAMERAKRYIEEFKEGKDHPEYARLQYLLAKEENRLRVARLGHRR